MTPPPHNQGSPNYRQTLRGYLRLHQLTTEGRDESTDADTVRDSLDLPWRALSADERAWVQGLSADLFSISEPVATGPLEMPPQAQKDLTAAFEAKQQREWDRALKLLRQCNKCITPPVLSYLRGGIWLEAEYPEVAAVFYEHAASLEPDNANYVMLFLHSLEQCNPARARDMASRILQNSGNHPPSLVVQAANVAFNDTREVAEPDAVVKIRALIPILTAALPRIPADEKRSVYLMGLVLLAQSHEHLGETGAALGYYSRGLGIDPSHDALLTGRGILTYGKSPQSAIDLEQAVRLRSRLVWPYFFLAHQYIISNRYEDCRQMCERGLEKNASPGVRSQLSEWLAIAEAELGFPPGMVRIAFEQALRLDTSNETARRNLEKFEQALRRPTAPKAWEKRSEATVRTFGQAERRVPIAA